MNLDLTGKHALVCGASQGIGRATALALAQLGADVTVLARTTAALEALVAALPRTHAAQRHAFVAADVAERRSLGAKVESCANAHPIQTLVNNTGGPLPGPAHTARSEDYLDTFERHLIANHTLVQAVLPGMRRSAWGRIVNVISTSVKEPIRNLGVSNTVRGAVASWAKTLSVELAPFGITVNNVLPGYTKTGRLEQIVTDRSTASGKPAHDIEAAMLATVPVGRFAEPDEIANAIAFLASPAAAYITGVSLAVDGGRMQGI
jgi:3-oxoacyl-[acyl-carrier protein] reductase